ncbi:Hypothetical predicted protein [Olea europaea subsp. europaea]|uniref:Uncharacterized protein n=1 Tax=Olea europaea subsp. europaea TaxID=158383 RepID=A0A8S0PCM8_OLEEU|nr:Hypothetical predicted protein [Olea europaea subsp. europaea]
MNDDNNVDKTLRMKCQIVKEYFRKSMGKITKRYAYNAFVSCKKRNSDKLGLIIILAYVLWATEENTYIDLWWLDLVDNLDRNKICYEISGYNTKNGRLENVEELEVNSSLVPNEAKLDEVYWKELTSIMEEDESTTHHFEGDEVEHDAKPHHAFYQHFPRASQLPPISQEINIVNLLRMEIEKLEGRL